MEYGRRRPRDGSMSDKAANNEPLAFRQTVCGSLMDQMTDEDKGAVLRWAKEEEKLFKDTAQITIVAYLTFKYSSFVPVRRCIVRSGLVLGKALLNSGRVRLGGMFDVTCMYHAICETSKLRILSKHTIFYMRTRGAPKLNRRRHRVVAILVE